MTQHGAFAGTAAIIFAAVLFAPCRVADAQDGSAQTIQMTTVPASVDKTVDAKKAKAGDAFTAKTTASTTLNDGTNVPAGSVLEGHVDSATPSEHKSDSTLVLTIDKVQIKGGKEIPVKAMIVRVATFEHELGGSGHSTDRAFDTSPRDSARMNGDNGAGQDASSGPHSVPGLTLTSAATDANSGTLTQAKGNVHLSNENQIQVSLAVVPAGEKVQ